MNNNNLDRNVTGQPRSDRAAADLSQGVGAEQVAWLRPAEQRDDRDVCRQVQRALTLDRFVPLRRDRKIPRNRPPSRPVGSQIDNPQGARQVIALRPQGTPGVVLAGQRCSSVS